MSDWQILYSAPNVRVKAIQRNGHVATRIEVQGKEAIPYHFPNCSIRWDRWLQVWRIGGPRAPAIDWFMKYVPADTVESAVSNEGEE